MSDRDAEAPVLVADRWVYYIFFLWRHLHTCLGKDVLPLQNVLVILEQDDTT